MRLAGRVAQTLHHRDARSSCVRSGDEDWGETEVMAEAWKLLVVDDEEVVCEGCRRIFAQQGFLVDTSTDPRQGLTWAIERPYDAVLLDIKMPKVDGLKFLERLRSSKPDLPVILITGYPSVPTAQHAVRLGAADYITKPFTPEEVTHAVRRLLEPREQKPEKSPSSCSVKLGPWLPETESVRFWNESWVELGSAGPLRVGAIVPPSEGRTIQTLRLPNPGDAVYRGLPLAGLMAEDRLHRTLPSPVSGTVVEVNQRLLKRFSCLWEAPLTEGWLARVLPSQLEQDVEKCQPRRVMLVNRDAASARSQTDYLGQLGYSVHVAATWDELAPLVPDRTCNLLLLDDTSLGEEGPELLRQLHRAAPSTNAIVLASAGSRHEAAYRHEGIFYYAVAPFADCEIVEVLEAAFRAGRRSAAPVRTPRAPSSLVSSVFATSRSGRQVGLLLSGGVLSRDEGLGWYIRCQLSDRQLPIKTASGIGRISQLKLLTAASMCERLLVLVAKDIQRLPGTMVRDTKGECFPVPREIQEMTTALVIQPLSADSGLEGFDDQTMEAIAEHVADEMASC